MDQTCLQFVIYSLAAFRLSLLVSKEDGPYWVFARLRKLPPAKSSTREGINCIWCVSVWAAALIVTAEHFWGNQWTAIGTYILAVSGAAICWNQAFTKS